MGSSMRATWKAVLLVSIVPAFSAAGGRITSQPAPPQPVSVTTSAGDHVVLQIRVDDRAARPVAAVGSLVVKLDDRKSSRY